MRLSDIEVVSAGNHCELRAQVTCDPTVAAHPNVSEWFAGGKPCELWYRFPKELQEYIRADNGDPFVPALLAPAMSVGEPLQIDAPVSAQLLAAIPKLQDIYACWQPEFSRIAVQAPVRPPASPRATPTANGLFFSLGMDSFYSLLKNVRDHPNDESTISHLIMVHGFDVYVDKWNSGTFPALQANAQLVAEELNKTLLTVATNLHDVGDPLVDWVEIYHGPALASVALALEGLFGAVHMAASHTYAHLFPLGSHPLVDPLWSTENLTLIHDGCEASRMDKARLIAQSDVALATLHVCTAMTEDYNCCRCDKCLLTMGELAAAGALDRCGTLPHHLDPAMVRSMRFENESRRMFMGEVLAALEAHNLEGELQAAIRERLATAERSQALAGT
ncbi:MAG: hypothetical protein ABFD96_04315 [Armatimonadia bacterium]